MHRFVIVNYSDSHSGREFHGKALALDINHHHAPFPSLFLIHEMRVRGFHPFKPVSLALPDGNPWQDWTLSDGVLDDTSGSFKHEADRQQGPRSTPGRPAELQFQPAITSAGGPSSGGRTLELNASVVADILAATQASASWKACMEEGTSSWTGTTEENIQKYVSSTSTQDGST